MIPDEMFIAIIDNLLEILYDKKESYRIAFSKFLEDYTELKLNSIEFKMLLDKIVKTGYFHRWVDQSGPAITNDVIVSQAGIELIYSHGTYLALVKEQQANKIREEELQRIEKENILKKEKAVIFSNRIKNWESVATIIFGAATIVLSIIAAKQESNLGRIQNTIELQSKKMDSIMQYKSSTLPSK